MTGRELPLLRRASTDEYQALELTVQDRRAAATAITGVERLAQHANVSVTTALVDRRTTAATLRSLNEAWGDTYFEVPVEAVFDAAHAQRCFDGSAPLIDVQTHLVDTHTFAGQCGQPLAGFLKMVDPQRWSDPIDPQALDAAAWAATVFGRSETAVAVLTSTPGVVGSNVLHNGQIAAVREVMDRYAGSGRVLTHTIVHPNIPGELDAMAQYCETLRPDGWKCYTLYGPPTDASPTGGWFLDDPAIGTPFLEAVRALGPRVVATHKGLGGPIPDARMQAASPRDVGPAAAAFPDIDFLVYHSGYEINTEHHEVDYEGRADGVDRLITSLRTAGVGPGGNVYAELGSTWFLMVRRPKEAAHVLGKLILALGVERVIWGTDSIWYGSPQPLIDAFRAFNIPEAMCEEFGYPRITPEMKSQMLSSNAQRVYGISNEALALAELDRDRTWIPEASVALLRAVERSR